MSHDYIGHNCMDHNYHDYMGHNCIGRGFGKLYPTAVFSECPVRPHPVAMGDGVGDADIGPRMFGTRKREAAARQSVSARRQMAAHVCGHGVSTCAWTCAQACV